MLTTVISHMSGRPRSNASRRACLVALVAAVVLGGGACRLKADSEAPKSVAPPFTLADEDGKATSLADLTRSGHAVLVFYRGHW